MDNAMDGKPRFMTESEAQNLREQARAQRSRKLGPNMQQLADAYQKGKTPTEREENLKKVLVSHGSSSALEATPENPPTTAK